MGATRSEHLAEDDESEFLFLLLMPMRMMLMLLMLQALLLQVSLLSPASLVLSPWTVMKLLSLTLTSLKLML